VILLLHCAMSDFPLPCKSCFTNPKLVACQRGLPVSQWRKPFGHKASLQNLAAGVVDSPELFGTSKNIYRLAAQHQLFVQLDYVSAADTISLITFATVFVLVLVAEARKMRHHLCAQPVLVLRVQGITGTGGHQ